MTDLQEHPISSRQATAHLSKSMDGRALNLEQQHLLHNQTPEADCVLDHLRDLLDVVHDQGVRRKVIAPLLHETRRLHELNRREGSVHMSNAGAWDDLASALHDREVGRLLTLRSFVRAISEPLKVLAAHVEHTPLEVSRATARVHRALKYMPDGALEASFVINQLKATKHRLLLEIAEGATA